MSSDLDPAPIVIGVVIALALTGAAWWSLPIKEPGHACGGPLYGEEVNGSCQPYEINETTCCKSPLVAYAPLMAALAVVLGFASFVISKIQQVRDDESDDD